MTASPTKKLARAHRQPRLSHLARVVGGQAFLKYVKMRRISDMLEHLMDTLMPRDMDRLAEDGFQEVLERVRSVARR